MFVILKKNVSLIEVNKSKFISIVGYLDKKESFKDILDNIKKEYPMARHYCYAYVCDNYNKYSDDGEPSGTAGKPLMSLLTNNNLTNSFVVVVRYFGGIKLGASNLLRTYIESANKAIKEATLGEIISLEKTRLELDNNDELYLLTNLKDKYGLELENIIYNIKIEVDVFSKNDLKDKIKNIFKGKYDVNNIEYVSKIVEVTK